MKRSPWRTLALFTTTTTVALFVGGCAHSTSPSFDTGATLRQAGARTTARRGLSGDAQLRGDSGTEERTDSEPTLDDEQDEGSDVEEARTDTSNKPHPLASYTDSELKDLFNKHPALVGSISIGKPNAGRLMNGVRPKESPLYRLEDPAHAWGTTETVDALTHVLQAVAQAHPGTQTVAVGHISAAEGGPLHPHRSHQAGRDVDLGLYYVQPGVRWYTRATGQTLDVPRTWTLIRSLATDTDIEMILLDRRLQEEIENYAKTVEHDVNWVHRLFHGDGKSPALVRHCPGHATHLHLRFYNPIARETARRLLAFLPAERQRVVRETTPTTTHLATSGDTLAKIAQRYHTTMDAIRRANHMNTFQLVAGQRYVIPLQVVPAAVAAPQRRRNSSNDR